MAIAPRAQSKTNFKSPAREVFRSLDTTPFPFSDDQCPNGRARLSRRMNKESGRIIYSPSDLIRYLASPFASWLDRYHLENPGAVTPGEQTDEEKLLSRTGDEHERSILTGYKSSESNLVEITKDDFALACATTAKAIGK